MAKTTVDGASGGERGTPRSAVARATQELRVPKYKAPMVPKYKGKVKRKGR